jgi:hypothetical protein
MRPQGEIRLAVLAAIRERGPLPLREVAAAAQVSYADAKRTVSRCVQAQQLVVAGREKPANSRAWKQIYDIAPPPAPIEPRHGHGWVDLGRAVAGWAR